MKSLIFIVSFGKKKPRCRKMYSVFVNGIQSFRKKILSLLVKYFPEETALWLLCGGRYWRGGHEVDVQVFRNVRFINKLVCA